MTLEDLLRLAAGIIDSIPVCRLPPDVCKAIGAKTSIVRLSTASLKHILKDHKDTEVSQILMLPKAIQWGLLVRDGERPSHIVACYQDPHSEKRRFIAVLKVTAKGDEIWVSTFHRAAPRQTKRVLEKGKEILKKHDPQ